MYNSSSIFLFLVYSMSFCFFTIFSQQEKGSNISRDLDENPAANELDYVTSPSLGDQVCLKICYSMSCKMDMKKNVYALFSCLQDSDEKFFSFLSIILYCFILISSTNFVETLPIFLTQKETIYWKKGINSQIHVLRDLFVSQFFSLGDPHKYVTQLLQ